MQSTYVHFIRDYLFTLPVLAKFALGMVMLVIIPRASRRLHILAACSDWRIVAMPHLPIVLSSDG